MNYAIGVVCALISAITFGVIPLFSVSLMKQGLHFNNVVFYRYIVAAAVIALVMRVTKKSLKITHKELPLLCVLAFLNVACSFFLMWGYTYLNSGLATSLYFLYPVFVSVAMIAFFGEKKSVWIGLSIFLAVFGVSLLSSGGGVKSSTAGILIVLTSALFYASYIVATNKTAANAMEPLKFTFYVLFLGALYSLAYAIGTNNVQMVSFDPHDLMSLAGLILFSTVISNLALIGAIQKIGSTMTAIFGALQPLTAVFVGVWVFKEPFTKQIVYSTACIIASVLIVLVSKSLKNPLTWNWRALWNRIFGFSQKIPSFLKSAVARVNKFLGVLKTTPARFGRVGAKAGQSLYSALIKTGHVARGKSALAWKYIVSQGQKIRRRFKKTVDKPDF